MLCSATAESSSKSRQLTFPVLSDTFLSFKDHGRQLSHRDNTWSLHHLPKFPGLGMPWVTSCIWHKKYISTFFPIGHWGWYHLSSLENYMDKFTKAYKSQAQCAQHKHYVIKRAFPFSKKANHNIRTVIRCTTFQLSNKTVRKQKVLL